MAQLPGKLAVPQCRGQALSMSPPQVSCPEPTYMAPLVSLWTTRHTSQAYSQMWRLCIPTSSGPSVAAGLGHWCRLPPLALRSAMVSASVTAWQLDHMSPQAVYGELALPIPSALLTWSRSCCPAPTGLQPSQARPEISIHPQSQPLWERACRCRAGPGMRAAWAEGNQKFSLSQLPGAAV